MKSTQIDVGSIRPGEADQLGTIYFNAIRFGTNAHYDFEQRKAWAPTAPSGQNWERRLMSSHTFVARIHGTPVGFMTLDGKGYIDLAFVDPFFQGQGIGQALYDVVEEVAQEEGIAALHAQASYVAKRLFERNGWEVLRKQKVTRSNVELANFAMRKRRCS